MSEHCLSFKKRAASAFIRLDPWPDSYFRAPVLYWSIFLSVRGQNSSAFVAVAAGGSFSVGLLLFKLGDEDGFDVGVGGFESVVLVVASDFGFDGGGLADGGEKLVGGELPEGVAAGFAGDAGLLEDPLAGVEGEDGVADPGLGAFFFFSHGWVVREPQGSRMKVE